jgi:DNA topoisomerase-3
MNSRHGGFRLTPVGRVQTPTLTILAKRERDIQAFEPRTFYEAIALFEVESGRYEGRWINEGHKKDENDPHKKAERIWDQATAQAIHDRCVGKPGRIEQKTKPARQAAPLLYDLTSLQREASNRFGFSARRTLQIAQALYEKYKLLTYPRTDSRHLPEDYVGTVIGHMKTIAGAKPADAGGLPSDLIPHAGTVVSNHWVRPNKRIFDDKKVSDHFAIIPTGQMPKKPLPEAEQKVYDMVTRRFIAVFFPPAQFEVTTRITRVGEDAFKSDGKVLVEPGWLGVYGKKAVGDKPSDNEEDTKGSKLIVPAKDGDTASTLDVEVKELQTKPPPRFTEATLLSTMEGAGKLVEDEELAEAMSERGLGTPATRASIIEGLISDRYIEREGRDFLVTGKGLALIDQISEIGIESLSSPELTGQWEYKLRQMEQNKLDRDTFMGEIRDLTDKVVGRTKSYTQALKERVYPEFKATCAFCGADSLKQTEDFYSCKTRGCKVRVYKTIAGREMAEDELRTLIETRMVGPLDGFRSKKGRDFSAALQITDEQKINFVFPDGTADPDAIKWDECPVLCPCQICADKGVEASIYDTPDGYICKEAVTGSDCNAKLPKVLCKKEITADNARLFFTAGKTALIEGMISKKGRPFKAYLVCNPGEKRLLSWEFPPRAPKKKAAKKTTTKKAS